MPEFVSKECTPIGLDVNYYISAISHFERQFCIGTRLESRKCSSPIWGMDSAGWLWANHSFSALGNWQWQPTFANAFQGNYRNLYRQSPGSNTNSKAYEDTYIHNSLFGLPTTVVCNLFGNKDWFCGKQFFQRPGGGMILVSLACPPFTSSCAARILTGHGQRIGDLWSRVIIKLKPSQTAVLFTLYSKESSSEFRELYIQF